MFAAGSFLLMMTMGMVLDIFGNEDDEAQSGHDDSDNLRDHGTGEGAQAHSMMADDPDAGAGTVEGGASMATILEFAAYASEAEAGSAELPDAFDGAMTGTDGADVLRMDGGSSSFGQVSYLAGLGGDDVLEGSAGMDVLFGGGGDDELSGGAGNDVLVGGDGADLLNGGEDDDWIYAGQNDTATGGEGADTFILGSWYAEPGEPAHVTDYDDQEDQIVVVYDPETGPPPEITVQTDPDTGVSHIYGDGAELAQVDGPTEAEDIVVFAQALDAF
ncbi:hypothetical protein BV394_08285 [Brevirhabdus pacifica]|uniref:Uncharacterized protein n=1 Tax=Brevirhabdus pacifica TaxID=1267768 RepID=A0A1U7DI96_9RHOB|nr:calcium-binding protein [Brevirhabdus pacifica]APX89712.1 hypothetical protein BV394_08285 [Brevirhabdus pacifica]PJJ85600.1 hemolysin type calcium-binding protein [Brevirhabdus pacifica]